MCNCDTVVSYINARNCLLHTRVHGRSGRNCRHAKRPLPPNIPHSQTRVGISQKQPLRANIPAPLKVPLSKKVKNKINIDKDIIYIKNIQIKCNFKLTTIMQLIFVNEVIKNKTTNIIHIIQLIE